MQLSLLRLLQVKVCVIVCFKLFLVSGASTVTLDEIIASAKRKISQEYIDLRIPSPTPINDSDSETHHLARQRHLIGGTPWPKDIYHSDESDHKDDLSFVEHLMNSESEEDEIWFERDPPSISLFLKFLIFQNFRPKRFKKQFLNFVTPFFSVEDGEQEDFDELLK
jgi:hypothetical protein